MFDIIVLSWGLIIS